MQMQVRTGDYVDLEYPATDDVIIDGSHPTYLYVEGDMEEISEDDFSVTIGSQVIANSGEAGVCLRYRLSTIGQLAVNYRGSVIWAFLVDEP